MKEILILFVEIAAKYIKRYKNMAKLINENDLKQILKIEAKNFSEFLKQLFCLYPDGLDMSKLNTIEKQKFKAKELSYSVCGDMKYNDPQLICDRCKSRNVAQFIYGDVFMRICNGNKIQKRQEMERLKHRGCLLIHLQQEKKMQKIIYV